MNHRNNAKALVLTVLFLVSSWNLQALNVQTFNPSITQGGGFRVLGAETLPAGSAAFGLGLNFVKGSLTVQDITGGGIEREIVPWMFTQNLQAEAGLCRRFTLGLDLPLSLVKQLPVGGGTTTDKAYSVGDLSLYGRLNILSQQNSFLGLAVVPFIEVPTGAVDHFTGDEGVVLGVKAAIEKTIGRFNSAINIGYRGRTSDNTVSQGAGITPLSVGDEITYGLAASVELIKNRLDLVGDLYGSTTVSDFGTDRQSSPL